MTLPATIKRSAEFSPGRTYRYTLTREWDTRKPKCLMILLNPSTADETVDDNTIRRGMVYGDDWGYGILIICNIFAYRATFPKELKKEGDPTGPRNDEYLKREAKEADLILCAWGLHGTWLGRDQSVLQLLRGFDLHTLRITKDGHPNHILYLPKKLKPKPWNHKTQL